MVIQKIMTLFQGEVNADTLDHFRIVLATLYRAQKSRRKTSAAG